MKIKSLIAAIIVVIAVTLHAQQTQNLLDGKKFSITLMKDGTVDSKETIAFDKGMMDPIDCHQWGFTASTYQAKNSAGMLSWVSTSKSDKEGTMGWQGKINGEEIEGSVSWVKEGQPTINYTFKGKEIKAESK